MIFRNSKIFYVYISKTTKEKIIVYKAKKIVYITQSQSGYSDLLEKTSAPKVYYYVKVIDDNMMFYYNINHYLTKDFDDASIFSEALANNIANKLRTYYGNKAIVWRSSLVPSFAIEEPLESIDLTESAFPLSRQF